MNALLIFAFVFAMANPAEEELQVSVKLMTLAACNAHVEKVIARYRAGGRWAESYRHFSVQCVPIGKGSDGSARLD